MNEPIRLEYKLGDTGEELRATLVSADEQPVDLSGASVTFKARFLTSSGDLTEYFNEAATIESDGVDGADSVVSYDPLTNWFTIPGIFLCDFKIAKDGRITSYPSGDDYIEIEINGD